VPAPLVLSLLVATAPAAAAETPRLALAEVLERAKGHSARLQALGSLEQAAEAGVRGARAGRLPQLELQASYFRNSDVPELVLAIPGLPARTIFPNIPDHWRTRAQATQPLYTGGGVAGQIDAAGFARDAARQQAEDGRDELVLEAATAYWSLVTAREAERVLREAVHSYESHLKDARNRLDLGLVARNEVLAVQVERDRAELQRLEAGNAARIANANLLRLTGLPEGTQVEPSEGLDAPSSGGAAELQDLVREAQAGRADLEAVRSRVSSLEGQARAAQAASRPQAFLQAGYDWASPNSRVLPLSDAWQGTWSVGAVVSLNAWDGGRTRAAVAQVRAQTDSLRNQLEDAERSVALEVEARLLDLRNSEAAYAVAERNLEAARENVRVTRDRYQEGVALSSELLDAETALLHAGLDLTRAGAGWRLGHARLDRAVGR